MIYLSVFVLLFALELTYFRIAKKFNIVDRPNSRSSHEEVTLRGGGIIFYFAILLYFVIANFSFPYFVLGLTALAAVSFLDDLYSLSNKIRLSIQFVAVLFLAIELGIISMEWYFLLILFVFVVGVINACNFMDGINGITAAFSLSVVGLLIIVNLNEAFIDQRFLYFVLLSIIVFAFFNFRIRARCFAGDVGSVAIAYIMLFMIGCLVIKTNQLIYLLFLTVYGIDTIWTILQRLINKENIFDAHRSHLYQYLANEAGYNKLLISFSYGVIQFIIGLFVIFIANCDTNIQILFTVILLAIMSTFYLKFKKFIVLRYVKR
ncbi:UDP-GlcNAc--UDP-phosphate GlcNAc-1-phosphate transferase [Sphingobacterium sp. DK4209]|uniref:UDP-GlcNAc--UDP-phosphate GlcNAc-1-phosphate transferase n=1 Tax=Sphingobacterium zhuxiongii TaxID=2662364 RepID=A0A5Q0QF99_9SPHI|nr:UDP-GlcNAc--UDP-phosphate GlcNAc-1-phosphate transferase [Sphingobacterium sp. DK4209]QGA28296.1 UDP-GlcNAc--UDP-phosphate GlcNAc-1-phosphate transferase [Sphingobacterium sp. dk4302]